VADFRLDCIISNSFLRKARFSFTSLFRDILPSFLTLIERFTFKVRPYCFSTTSPWLLNIVLKS
jgi:hypothetical protein